MFVSNEQQQEENRMDTFDMDTFMESLTGSEAELFCRYRQLWVWRRQRAEEDKLPLSAK
jgi:hypothetical protein